MNVEGLAFGKFHLCADRRLRFPSGNTVQLSRRASSVLAALVTERGSGVTKERLLESAWPDAWVDEQNLTRVIADLRKHFAAEGHHPIETIYGFGYRFSLPSGDRMPQYKPRRAESLRREAWNRVAARRIESLRSAEHLFSLAHDEHGAAEDWLGIAEIQIHRMQLGYARAADVWPIAVDALNRALDQNRADALAYLGYGLSCIERNFDRAEALLTEARRIDPENRLAKHCSGWRALSVGDFSGAIQFFEETTRIDPGNFNALGLAALTFLFNAQNREALDAIGRLRELDGEGPVAAGYIAWVESAIGEAKIGLEAAERCVAQLQGSPTALTLLARALAASDRKDAAVAVLNSTAADHTTVGCYALSSPAWLTLGDDRRGMDALQHGTNEHCPWASIVRHDPRVAPLTQGTKLPPRDGAPRSHLSGLAR